MGWGSTHFHLQFLLLFWWWWWGGELFGTLVLIFAFVADPIVYCFLKCLSICVFLKVLLSVFRNVCPFVFFSKLHFAVFGNVCPFIFLQTAFALFLKMFVHSFFEPRFLKTAFAFFRNFIEMFVCLFFPQTTCVHVCFSKCLSILFFSKLHAHLAVFRNVCPFVFSPNCILLFFKMFVRSFFSKMHLLFFLNVCPFVF